MSLYGIKKSPLRSLPLLKKRLRRITALGFRNLTVNEFNFKVHFTLHRSEKTVAFYTSEPVENQRSPEWSYLKFPESMECLQDFFMRLWITSPTECRLFLEYDVHLDGLLYPDEQKDDSKRQNNSLWLEMFGYQFTDYEPSADEIKSIQYNDTDLTITDKKTKRINVVKSYNKSSISRMINFIDAIRAKNRSSTQCLERLQTLVNTNEDYLSKIKERETRRLRIENLKQYLQTEALLYEQRLDTNEQRQKLINERKNRLDGNIIQLSIDQTKLNSRRNQLNESKHILLDFMQLNTFRQKNSINEIYRSIYPIVGDSKMEYSIANVRLPNAEDKIYQTSLSRERENEIEAAVGYCAHFVCIISQFIQLPIRFPIEFYGTCPIKISDHNLSSDFPLYPGYDMNSFQYGLFLLNRNIGQIMYHCRVGARKTDYRRTLANLKDLLEQYFTINFNENNQIQLYDLTQLSVDMTTSTNSSISTERFILNNQDSLLSPSSSLLDLNDLDQSGDDNSIDVDLYSMSTSMSPRLAMQFSQPAEQ